MDIDIKYQRLFGRILISRYIKEGSADICSIMCKFKKTYMISCGWALGPENYWYDKDPSNAKFIDFRKKVQGKNTHCGFYVGRLALGYSFG